MSTSYYYDTIVHTTILCFLPKVVCNSNTNPLRIFQAKFCVLQNTCSSKILGASIRVGLLYQAVCVSDAAAQLASRNEMVQSRTYDALQQQMWSLLPGFCTNPTDFNAVSGPSPPRPAAFHHTACYSCTLENQHLVPNLHIKYMVSMLSGQHDVMLS